MFFNRIKACILLIALSGLFLSIGHLIGGINGMYCALIFSFFINGITYFFSDKIVLSMYNAHSLDTTEYEWIYDSVKELSTTMNIPMPKLWIISHTMANAFATGRNPNHASIALTTGIISLLDTHELRGVLAHELAHIKNRDILLSTIAATIATSIGYCAHMLRHAAFWSSFSNNKRRGNPIALFIVALLLPIAATILQLALSRSREYLADETGAYACHDPLALASALEKLHNNIPHAHMNTNQAHSSTTASLFIVHPFSVGKSVVSLFSTHPPMNQRISRLRIIYAKMFS